MILNWLNVVQIWNPLKSGAIFMHYIFADHISFPSGITMELMPKVDFRISRHQSIGELS